MPKLVPRSLESKEGPGNGVFVVEREEVHSSLESPRGDSLSLSLLLLLLLGVPTSYSSNSVVVVVDGGSGGNADISSTI